jgi:hypothetical protein
MGFVSMTEDINDRRIADIQNMTRERGARNNKSMTDGRRGHDDTGIRLHRVNLRDEVLRLRWENSDLKKQIRLLRAEKEEKAFSSRRLKDSRSGGFFKQIFGLK